MLDQDSEVTLEKFNQHEIGLNYEQTQDIKNGNILKVLNEHSEYAQRLLKRKKVAITSGLILLIIGFYLEFSSDPYSLISTTVAGLGASSLTCGIFKFRRTKSYQENIYSLEEHFENKHVT